MDWWDAHVNVGELEDHIQKHAPTKLSAMATARLQDGGVAQTHDFLFLMPQRNLVEGRNSGVLDVTRYSSIGLLSSQDMVLTVSDNANNLFNRYVEKLPKDGMSMGTHVTRHMMTTELLRGGVSDATVAKHSNRENVETNRVYDHRNLEEMFAAAGFRDARGLADKTADLAVTMIKARMVGGPVVDEFVEVQKTRGDAAALKFLSARAPGFHATPFGFCIANFATDPCPKQLQCLRDDGCHDLIRTDSWTEVDNIKRHKARTLEAVKKLEAVPDAKQGPGWKNQLEYGRRMLANMDKALATKVGDRAFPSGPKKFRPLGGDSVLD
jgi:hypothetical protein